MLGFVPRIVIASLIGYTAGQLLNAWVLVKMKDRNQDGPLWTRLVGSTVVGEFADTVLFCVIAFVGVFPTWTSLGEFHGHGLRLQGRDRGALPAGHVRRDPQHQAS